MNRVKEIRKEKRLTQDEVAKLVGISRKYLSSIETNRANPSVDIALKISQVLTVTVDKVFINEKNAQQSALPKRIQYIDLFCGIGGFRYAINQACEKLGII